MNIGFIAARLAGPDGVSLEMAKWVTALLCYAPAQNDNPAQ